MTSRKRNQTRSMRHEFKHVPWSAFLPEVRQSLYNSMMNYFHDELMGQSLRHLLDRNRPEIFKGGEN